MRTHAVAAAAEASVLVVAACVPEAFMAAARALRTFVGAPVTLVVVIA